MLVYNALIRLRHKLPVRSVAFLFRPQAASGPTGYLTERLDDHSWIEFSYRLVRLWEIPVEELLAGPVGMLPLAPLATNPSDISAVVSRVNRRLRAELPPAEVREMLQCTRLLMGLRFNDQLVESLMGTLAEVLEDSSTYQSTIRRGFTKGREEGLAEGIAQGAVAGQRQLILRVGIEKFGPPVESVEKRLQAIFDLDQLVVVATRLIKAQSWEELFIGLK